VRPLFSIRAMRKNQAPLCRTARCLGG